MEIKLRNVALPGQCVVGWFGKGSKVGVYLFFKSPFLLLTVYFLALIQ